MEETGHRETLTNCQACPEEGFEGTLHGLVHRRYPGQEHWHIEVEVAGRMADPECEEEMYAQRVEPECKEKLVAYQSGRMLDEQLPAMMTPTWQHP